MKEKKEWEGKERGREIKSWLGARRHGNRKAEKEEKGDANEGRRPRAKDEEDKSRKKGRGKTNDVQEEGTE